MNKKLLLTLLLLSPVAAFSAETKPVNEATPKSKWSGEAELGYLKTTGNTNTQSLNTKGKVVNERVHWKHQATIEVINKDENGTKTAKRAYVTAKSDYNINPDSFIFITATYEDDDFSGYDSQYTEALGYGNHIIKQDNMKLDFDWKFSKTSVFTQHLAIEAGDDTTITRSVTAVKVQVIGNLSAKFSHSIKNSSSVPVGKVKTDTESIITLVYSFK